MTGKLNDSDDRIELEPDAFMAAFEASPTPMVVTDPRRADNPIVWANPAFLKLTGYERHELYGCNCRIMQGPLSDPAVLRQMREAVAAGEPAECELFNYRKDGTPFWNGMTITPVRDRTGGLAYYFSAQADMTDKHRLETALKARRTPAGSAREALQGMADRIGALSTAHRMLYSADDVVRFDFPGFAREFIGDLFDVDERVTIEATIEDMPVSAAMAAPLALMLHELVINAVRHAFPQDRAGRVAVVGTRNGSGMTLTVTDDGIGLNGSVVDSNGFGRSLVDMVVRQLRGRVAYADADPGTRVEIAVPIAAHEMAP